MLPLHKSLSTTIETLLMFPEESERIFLFSDFSFPQDRIIKDSTVIKKAFFMILLKLKGTYPFDILSFIPGFK